MKEQCDLAKEIQLSKCDDLCDPSKAVRKGRATWVCAECGSDISLLFYLYQEALMQGEEIKKEMGKSKANFHHIMSLKLDKPG